MTASNPYEPPQSEPNAGLWPHSRRRRERMIYGTVRSWLLFGLRVLIFFAAIAAVLMLTRPAQP